MSMLTHQLVVFLHQLVNQGAAGFDHRDEVAVASVTAQQLHHSFATGGGQIEQQTLLAKTGSDVVRQRTQVDVVGFDFLLMTIMRHKLRSAARLNMDSVEALMPLCALITTSAVSAPANAPMAWPAKSG